MRTNGIVKSLLALLAVGLLGWMLYVSIEFYDETEEASWSIEALRNPYLAAQQFMDKSGIPVTDVDNLARLDELDEVGTLFFSDPNQVQTPRQLRQILGWLESGGNVIYTASSLEHDDDLLLAELGIEVAWHETDEEEEDLGDDKSLSEQMREYNRKIEEGKSREEIVEELEADDDLLTTVRFDDDIGELEVAFRTEKVLINDYDSGGEVYEPFSWSNSSRGVHMMQFEIGAGLLTIISDPGIWTSYQIDQHDHAWLLWLLSSQDGSFAILRSVLRDSIWVLIGRNAPELLTAAALLVLLWIWRRGHRFGRLMPRDRARRRALGEHFSSVSHYLWHRRESDYLLAPLRQRIQSRASLTLAGFAGADAERQHELLAERCEIEQAAVARAFEQRNFNEASFVQTVRLLKTIEQSL